jgi:hypothetical protein
MFPRKKRRTTLDHEEESSDVSLNSITAVHGPLYMAPRHSVIWETVQDIQGNAKCEDNAQALQRIRTSPLAPSHLEVGT